MKRKILSCGVVMGSVIVAGVEGQRLLGTTAAAQTSRDRAGGVPTFQVDPSWPKVPSKWKLGDASSIGIDAQDRDLRRITSQVGKHGLPLQVFILGGHRLAHLRLSGCRRGRLSR